MLSSLPRGVIARLVLPLALLALLATVLVAPSSEARSNPGSSTAPPLQRVKAATTLNSVGDRYVGKAIPIKGYVSNQPRGKHRLALQRMSVGSHRWVRVSSKLVRNGAYTFASQRSAKAGTVRFRTVLYKGVTLRSRVADVSNVLRVKVLRIPAPPTCQNSPSPVTCPKPPSTVQEQTVDGPAYCQQLTIPTLHQERTVGWAWSTAQRKWVQSVGAWRTLSQTNRAAGAADCLSIIDEVPDNAALSDLRIKNLDKCGLGDLDRTGGDCFMVEYNEDGQKLLKFPVLTFNVGNSASEIIADRSAEDVEEWKGYETFYDAQGNRLGSKYSPGVEFYFAGDGHNHWHVRDFDEYDLLSADGTSLVSGEKHGYCLQDNTSYTPFAGKPGVPSSPVYLESTSCGKGLPNALTIVHGLSKGWGDTYPTTLPDQALNITGIPDGTYTVRVHADAKGAVTELNENNNTATIQIVIAGDDVTVLHNTAEGGLP